MFNEASLAHYAEFRYRPAKGLWVITAYYNPCGYERRYYNYRVFVDTLCQSGIPLLTVECAFGNQAFTLPKDPNVVQIRSSSVIWQKERLLNLAISWLPASCRYVAWVDCDVLFLNPHWANDTVELLNHVPLVQLFETCNRLPEENLAKQNCGSVCNSFGSITPRNPALLKTGHFEKHGHTGYGWAARRELLDRHGLYEYAIIGSGDHYIAHAAFGDGDGSCLDLMTDRDRKQIRHFQDWAIPFSESVEGRVGATPGGVLHLWHGNLEKRRYLLRNRELTELEFDPFTDITALPGKPLEWSSTLRKPKLISMLQEYFASREEDGSLAA